MTWLEDFLTSKWPGSFTALAPPLYRITADLRDQLHWPLPVQQRNEYKVRELVYKCLHEAAFYTRTYLAMMATPVGLYTAYLLQNLWVGDISNTWRSDRRRAPERRDNDKETSLSLVGPCQWNSLARAAWSISRLSLTQSDSVTCALCRSAELMKHFHSNSTSWQFKL